MQEMTLTWTGPFAWPTFGTAQLQDVVQHDAPQDSGLYLWTVPFGSTDEHLVQVAGHTKTFKKRFRTHNADYNKGTYSIFDADALMAGQRVKVWQGLWKRKATESARLAFAGHSETNALALTQFLTAYRIFLGTFSSAVPTRVFKRTEYALMHWLYNQPSPVCDVPDRGMSLSPRWPSESPIRLRLQGANTIKGLPSILEV